DLSRGISGGNIRRAAATAQRPRATPPAAPPFGTTVRPRGFATRFHGFRCPIRGLVARSAAARPTPPSVPPRHGNAPRRRASFVHHPGAHAGPPGGSRARNRGILTLAAH